MSSVIRFLRAGLELRWSGIASAGGGGVLKAARAGSRGRSPALEGRKRPLPPLPLTEPRRQVLFWKYPLPLLPPFQQRGGVPGPDKDKAIHLPV